MKGHVMARRKYHKDNPTASTLKGLKLFVRRKPKGGSGSGGAGGAGQSGRPTDGSKAASAGAVQAIVSTSGLREMVGFGEGTDSDFDEWFQQQNGNQEMGNDAWL